MTSAVEARELIVDIAGPVPLGTRLKEIMPAIAGLTGLSERRIRALWNQEARAILADEIAALRRAREEAIHARNLETRSRLARRGATYAGGVEGQDF